MINDLLSAGGLYGAPPLQKIYWAFTEGALATALLAGAPLQLTPRTLHPAPCIATHIHTLTPSLTHSSLSPTS